MFSTRLFTLGTPRLERDGVPLDLTYRKNAALLAYLAVTGERHTREALITLLWPELEPSRARAGLRRNLSVLRKVLGGEVLLVDRETVGLDPEADLWLDVDQFRRLLSAWRGHGHPEADVCSECLTALAEAVELYRGDFLAGFSLRDSLAFDEWQFFETEELRRELASALERLVRGHSAQGAYESAIPYARRWLALDPLHEPAHRHLMQLYAQTGQRAAALRQYQECARILEAELGLSPSRETTSLYERIRAQPADRQVPFSSAPVPQHNLPAQTTPFVGRERELTEIAGHLRDPDCRLLSLVGPGGIGKTRLALEAAREQVGRYRDGTYWIPLAPMRSAETMVSALAQAVGCSLYGAGDPWPRLLDHLHDKRMLLILDNLEHLLDAPHPTGRGTVDLVNGILRAAPDVKVVITSRARPNVQSEHLLPVAGMEHPRGNWGIGEQGIGGRREPGAKDATRYSAVRLFLSHARRVCPGFEPTAEELADVAQVCRLVQGMPLAILLAATWMQMLSPAEIVSELEQGYGLLEADLRDLPERQRSIEVVFDASWRMLDDTEREAFARLSVFRGGFTRDAAECVADVSLRTLISLVHKSFLQRDAVGRFEIHELMRQYAEHRLAEVPETAERTSDLHCDHYAEILDREVASAGRGGGWQGLLLEIDNVRAGWHWAVSQARFDRVRKYAANLFPALSWGLGWRQEVAATFGWAAEVLRTHYTDRACREAGVALGMILARQGTARSWSESPEDIERGIQLMQEGTSMLRKLGARREFADCVEANFWGPKHCAAATQLLQEQLLVFRELGDCEGMVFALCELGELAICQGDVEEAEQCYRQQVDICQKFGHTLGTDALLYVLGGKIAYHRGEYQKARQLYEKSLDGFAKQGKQTVAVLCSYLGDVALAMEDYGEARDRYREALAMQQTGEWRHWGESLSGDHYGMAYSLDRLGDIALVLGDVEEARGAYRQALEIARDHPQIALHLDVLVNQAALLTREGGRERAVELAALVLHHPASHVEVTRRAQRLLDQLRAKLPPDVFVEAQSRGRSRDLEATVKELLAELESGSLHPPPGTTQR